jgi:hypothetical protein
MVLSAFRSMVDATQGSSDFHMSATSTPSSHRPFPCDGICPTRPTPDPLSKRTLTHIHTLNNIRPCTHQTSCTSSNHMRCLFGMLLRLPLYTTTKNKVAYLPTSNPRKKIKIKKIKTAKSNHDCLRFRRSRLLSSVRTLYSSVHLLELVIIKGSYNV